ncbi:predicted protein [Ostreococcus lucimarinus CCE9901]|jgi:hypothetical protein|uniref:Uncharacterized protein n=1 Tax=Ostreococcus lucimarinus (strain CCE9901) TaxID=436017 RepID=A4S6H1_OSTLU|nr:predicted protein [Ostreococcus lucimarinus CCE9901]ABO99235.1 predicted protein [Ostreococcus lucimarinus CCE9901]|eukprot:XP_001420942.1 predicted protein [Ostreococcus lucimarinus CCE9901]
MARDPRGLDLLLRAARTATEARARDRDETVKKSTTVRFQTADATGRVEAKTRRQGKARADGAMRDRTNDFERGGTAGKGKRGRGRATMTMKAKANAPPPDVDDSAEATTVREETLAIGAETLAREHADVVIERVRQWLDVMMSDARGRLTALERSQTRTHRALEKYDSEEAQDDVGIEMLVEFDKTLEIERSILEETMKNLEAMRTKVEFESANLALRWLRRSNCGGDDDGQASEEDQATDGRKYFYSSSAYAFLQTAIGAFMNDTTPAKSAKSADAHSPSGVLDAARLFT